MSSYYKGNLLQMEKKLAVLVTGGIAPSIALLADFIKNRSEVAIYCADAGADYCRAVDVIPRNIIGDMDSIAEETKGWLASHHVEEYIYPVEKDYSDTALAIEALFHEGFEEILMLGALGGRMDHEMANMMELVRAGRRGQSIVFWDDVNALRYIGPGVHQLERCDGYVGIVPFSDAGMRLSIDGLYYKLEESLIEFGDTRMVSNEFRDENLATFNVISGDGVLIVSHDRREKNK